MAHLGNDSLFPGLEGVGGSEGSITLQGGLQLYAQAPACPRGPHLIRLHGHISAPQCIPWVDVDGTGMQELWPSSVH